jgi:hypothetical protein
VRAAASRPAGITLTPDFRGLPGKSQSSCDRIIGEDAHAAGWRLVRYRLARCPAESGITEQAARQHDRKSGWPA